MHVLLNCAVTTASTPSPKIAVNPSVQKLPPPPAKASVPTVTSTVNTRSKGKLNSRTPETNNSEIVPPKTPSSKGTRMLCYMFLKWNDILFIND